MSVFKYHAFIYFLRPPPWYGTWRMDRFLLYSWRPFLKGRPVSPGIDPGFMLSFPSHNIIRSPVWCHVSMVWLFPIILVILGWLSVSSPPSFLPPHRWYEVRTSPPPTGEIKFDLSPPLFPLLCWRSSDWSDLTINTEFKWKVLQYSLAGTRTCGHCGSHSLPSTGNHLIIIHRERVSNSFLVAVRYFSGGLPFALVWLSPLAA